ncbi:LLM class flavin-dependent oxidoreductase [Mycolicibacterium sp. BiH015]|uniref:LLM class flavin-dependent oxidoreductase n=1 Tax=Mycolicibacterium sp. BiH015 TaxID=3018808 RepID=UPI0022E4F3A0|nr:LLM class flavin-dependent oxidoreductase [Mycolicibacterium sp. BiH015]MDA2893243.1 LLM class flavin-dependent oxidoreductase [Mycolicibacterium sp. BiH015]
MSSPYPRFGIWSQVYGSWGSFHHPEEPPDASWSRNRAQVVEAEALGYDCALIAQHVFNPSGDSYDQLETWTATAALAAVTQRIELIAAIKPYLFHPVVFAKMAQQIEHISAGRLALNVVNAWFKPEYQKLGLGFADHGERYAYGREWLTIVRTLLKGQRTSFKGQFFEVSGVQLLPADSYRSRPAIYSGGESHQAQQLAADFADLFFLNGQPVNDVANLVNSASAKKRLLHPPLRFGMAAFVIARPTTAEAQDALAYAWRIAERDRAEFNAVYSNADPQSTMWQTMNRTPQIGTNGGTAAGLVGSFDEVAERIQQFHQIGIGTFLLQFQPFEANMRTFAHEVMPRVKRLLGR